MSHYLLHHIHRDTRFNRESSKHIAARRLPGSTILCPELIVILYYREDNITREVSKKENDSNLRVVASGLLGTQLTYLEDDKQIETIGKRMHFSGKALLRFLDVEISGGIKGIEAKFSAPHLEALLSIYGYVNLETNKMDVDYRRL